MATDGVSYLTVAMFASLLRVMLLRHTYIYFEGASESNCSFGLAVSFAVSPLVVFVEGFLPLRGESYHTFASRCYSCACSVNAIVQTSSLLVIVPVIAPPLAQSPKYIHLTHLPTPIHSGRHWWVQVAFSGPVRGTNVGGGVFPRCFG